MRKLPLLIASLVLFSTSINFNEIFLRPMLYLGVAEACRFGSQSAHLGWAFFQATPWASTYGNECLILSHLLHAASNEMTVQLLKKPSSETIPSSQVSWHLNQKLLSQIPAPSLQDQQLLAFLKKRWLAKANGFFSAEVDLICPAFGYSLQVNPETTNCYARDPASQTSQTYTDRMNAWKNRLPQPDPYPLILTRPFDMRKYLPSHIEISQLEEIQRLSANNEAVVVDLTKVLPQDGEEWLQEWEIYRAPLAKIDNEIICIQRVEIEGIGGLRILPLSDSSSEKAYQFLLDWISHFGLTANPVELDRSSLSATLSYQPSQILNLARTESQIEFLSFLNTFKWKSNRPEKNLMVQGALSSLRGLFDAVPEERWNWIFRSPTHSGVVNLSFTKIKEELNLLAEEKEDSLFFNTTAHLEQIFAHISNLLEITAPFSTGDFPSIYLNRLASIPTPLRALTSCSLHASAMASIGGVFLAVEKLRGSTPTVIYGENAYFECIDVANEITNAISTEDATDEDWKEVDLLLVQFNPVLKRSEPEIASYRRENIKKTLDKALSAREGKPLTAAIDCTIDFIDSPQLGEVLATFQQEITEGKLNIVCYRSGLKFDLFGMDNYAGAPFYMIHNQDPKWSCFSPLTNDSSFVTDRLSATWFCLAYKYAATYLDLYRKTIFENTRSLLNQAPSRLFGKNVEFRIIPVDQDALPSFIDIRISGPLQKIRGCSAVAAYLYLKSMQEGHPIFYRRSFGFYHPNFGMLFGKESSTVRLTLGLDPAQIDLFTNCLETIDTLNGS